MGTLAGILATAALSHLGGHLLGGVLGRFGLCGFGRKLKIARRVLRRRPLTRRRRRQSDSDEVTR